MAMAIIFSSPTINTITITITTLVFVVVVIVLRSLLTPLRNVPGPFLARFSRLWYLIHILKGNWEKVDVELHRRYGPIVRIAPNEYSIDDVDAVRVIYGLGTRFTKSPWYSASGNPLSNTKDLFSDLSPTRHAANRRKVAQLYSVTNLLKMEPCVRECTALLISRLEDSARTTGEVLDMQHWLQCYAFDVIGLITVSRRFGFLDEGRDHYGMFKALHAYLRYCAVVGVYWELHPRLYRLLAWIGKSGMAYMTEFARRQIEERKQNQKQKQDVHDDDGDDFLGRVLAMHAADSDRFTSSDVLTTCITNIGAGSDTTSISLSAILWYLIKTPRCMGKLRDEISQKEKTNQLSNPITFQQSQQMPYLQAVIKEGLRMHPATGLPLGRVVPNGGEMIAGRLFPEGTIVGINTWVAHRNKSIFGPDVNIFRPERWLDLQDEEKLRKMERYFLPFGHGSRTCIGKNISLMEISTLIPELVRRFDFEIAEQTDVDDGDGDGGDALRTENVWFVKLRGFRCRVTVRVR